MGSYYVPIVDVLRGAGCVVRENDITAGWERRARGSGGFDSRGAVLGIQWHHTASKTSVTSDLSYMIDGSPDRPVGNVLLDRDGVFWPIAAGAANTSGKGGPSPFSRGTVPKDSGNTRLFSIEIANNGVGESWPCEQIDAAFLGSNAMNAYLGNLPEDVISHALGSGDGYTDRKIDPATAAAVQGAWRPASANTSGSWLLADLRAECRRRATPVPTPEPPTPGPRPIEGDTMLFIGKDSSGRVWIGDRVTRYMPTERAIDAHLWEASIGGPACYQPPSDETSAANPFRVTWRGEIPSPGDNMIEWMGDPR